METDKYQFLDIGGGPNEEPWFNTPDIDDVMSNLRAVQLARQNPNGEYTVLDAYFPPPSIETISSELPNVHFVTHILSPESSIPFGNGSMDRVEMNFVFTPLTDQLPINKQQYYLIGFNPELYIHALEEACRVLKSGGTLAITEKSERLNKIKGLLSRGRWFDLDGYLMAKLGLDTSFGGRMITEVTDPTRTLFTEIAIGQQRVAQEQDDRKRATELKVFCLEIRKK